MAKPKTKELNKVYKNLEEGMTLDIAKDWYTTAKSKNEDRVYKFNSNYDLYNKEYDGNNAEFDKNMIFELIESEIDNNMYLPKCKSLNGRIEAAQTIENILKNELNSASYREFNDIQERNTYIFGVSITHVSWDRTSRRSGVGGKLKFTAIDPRCFIPQAGVNNIDDMDYCFVTEQVTKLSIINDYLLSYEQADLLNNDDVIDVNNELVCLKTMYYKDRMNHVCRFVWCGDLVLANDSNIYSDKQYYCSKCGTMKDADQDTCLKCKNSKFELKEVSRKSIKSRKKVILQMQPTEANGGQTSTIMYQEEDLEVTPYVPNKLPFIIRKNISTMELYGLSDVSMIKNNQTLYNNLVNKLAERVLKSGTIIGLPKSLKNKVKLDNSELKEIWTDTPAELANIVVKTLQPQFGNETLLMDSAYNTARQTLGITNSFQGREDKTAISSKSKEVQIAQTAGRLESKREMKKTALIQMYQLMFEFILAYANEYHGYYRYVDGEEQYKVYDNRLFLVSDGNTIKYDDEFVFDIDLSASLENNREQMWQETRLNFSSGAFGDPKDINTIKLFWQMMRDLNYPKAKESLDFIDKRISQDLIRQQMEQEFKNRELQLQQSSNRTQDMLADRDSQAKNNVANAEVLKSLESMNN